MKQKIVIAGIKNKYAKRDFKTAMIEVLGVMNKEEQAVFEFVGAAEAAAKVSITRAYENDADKITIDRDWTDAGWTEYQTHSTNSAAVKSAMEAAGYTVTITETA
jgi:phytoene/squalene synthetase